MKPLTRLFLLPLVALASLAHAAEAATPGELVRSHSQQILDQLDAHRAEFRKAPDQLQAFIMTEMDQLFDRDYSARLVLGRHSRSAQPEQISRFGAALTENLLDRYGNALLDVDPGLKVRIRSETPLQDGRMMRVATEIERRQGEPVPVDYMFHETEDGWRAFDVIVEGVSYVQTYRTQFDELLRRDTLDQVTDQLAAGAISVHE